MKCFSRCEIECDR